MNIILIIVLIIVGLITLLLVLALFTRKDYAIERSISIHRPVSEVFNYIRHLKNQDHFNKWVMVDPDMKKAFRGSDGTVGFVYAWNGNKRAGEGEQEIMNIVEGKRIDIEIRFVRPFEAKASAPMVTEQKAPDLTLLTWGMSSSMKYPMNIMLLFVDMDKMLGKDLEESMGTLKGILEKR